MQPANALRDVPDAAAPVTLCRIGLLTYEGRWQEAATHAANLCALERDVPDHFLLAAAYSKRLLILRPSTPKKPPVSGFQPRHRHDSEEAGRRPSPAQTPAIPK